MIRAVFGRDRVTVMGHAGYAPKGQDIVCAAASALVFALIGSLRQEENLTVFLTTHYMEEAADAGYVVLLDHGRIAAEGTPLQLKNTYAHDTLTLYGVGEADVRRLGLPYAAAEQGWRVTVRRPRGRAGRSWSWCGADWRSWRRSIPNA